MSPVMGNITSANASLVLTVDTIFPTGIILQQFATDQSLSMDEIQITETRMGVDGNMAAGVTLEEIPITIMLEASSPCHIYLSTIWSTMRSTKIPYTCRLVATVPSIKQIYTWTPGTMKSGMIVPAFKKVLDPTSWKFHFADLQITSY